MAAELASEIPGATLGELTPKCVDTPQHNLDFQRHLLAFLREHFPNVE